MFFPFRSVLQSSRFQLTENGSSILWCRPVWDSDESEDSLDWNINNDTTELTSDIAVTDNNVHETENWDVDNSDANLVNDSDVCWNTATSNNTCQYWDGVEVIESESELAQDLNTENDDNMCSSKDVKFQLGCSLYSNKDDDDDDDQAYGLEDDGLIWISSDDTSKG
jgi:hypothetical protein